MIELIISMYIILISVFAIHDILIRSLILYQQNKNVVIASNAASMKLEEITSATAAPAGGSGNFQYLDKFFRYNLISSANFGGNTKIYKIELEINGPLNIKRPARVKLITLKSYR